MISPAPEKVKENPLGILTKKPPGKRPAVGVFFQLQSIFDQAVATVVSAVDHSERSVVVLIPESKEVVLQQIHLQNGFFPAHGPEIELLDPDDAEVLFFFIGHKGGFLSSPHECILAQPTSQAGLVLADLPLNGAHSGINGSKHIGGTLACPEPGACTVNGEFHIDPVLFYREYDERFRILLEIPGQFHNLLFGVGVDIAGQFDFLLTKLEFLMRRSFLLPVFRCTITIP